jgi:hypothetical protein
LIGVGAQSRLFKDVGHLEVDVDPTCRSTKITDAGSAISIEAATIVHMRSNSECARRIRCDIDFNG